jgi:hypothetical protein
VKKGGNAASNQSLFKSAKSSGKPLENGQSERNCEKKNNANEQKPSSPYSIELIFSIFDDKESHNEEKD